MLGGMWSGAMLVALEENGRQHQTDGPRVERRRAPVLAASQSYGGSRGRAGRVDALPTDGGDSVGVRQAPTIERLRAASDAINRIPG